MITIKYIEDFIKEYGLYLPFKGDDRFFNAIESNAMSIINANKVRELDFEKVCDMLLEEQFEKALEAKEKEDLINFNDEIVDIEFIGKRELMDITVSRDNLFYANGILTENSYGLPQTLDAFYGIMQTPELAEKNQYMIKQLKSRFGDLNKKPYWVMGVNKAKMTLFDAISDDNHINQSVERVQSMHAIGKLNNGGLNNKKNIVFN